jgi:hypothetical protein
MILTLPFFLSFLIMSNLFVGWPGLPYLSAVNNTIFSPPLAGAL